MNLYNTTHRSIYFLEVQENSQRGVMQIDLLKAAADKGDIPMDVAVAKADEVAIATSEQRNIIRSRNQARVTPGALVLSQLVEKFRDPEEILSQKKKAAAKNPASHPLQPAMATAVSAGHSNKFLKVVTHGGRALGIVGIIVVTYDANERYQAAPEGQKRQVVLEEAAGISLGIVSADAGAAAGASAGAPFGVVGVIGGAIIGGFAGGIFGDSVGRGIVRDGVLHSTNDMVRAPDGSIIDRKTYRMTLGPGPKF